MCVQLNLLYSINLCHSILVIMLSCINCHIIQQTSSGPQLVRPPDIHVGRYLYFTSVSLSSFLFAL